MLFYWMIWMKLGWDDAHTFSVREVDLWLLLGTSLMCSSSYGINLLNYSIITFVLGVLVLNGFIGSADRDVLLILFITQSLHSWIVVLLFASLLALIHATVHHKKVVPFIFFISLGHLLHFCLETL